MAYPTLRDNEVITGIRNMIISQEIFADNQKSGATLADRFRTDGTLYGDTKLFYSVDILRSYALNLKNNKGVGGMDYNLLTEFLPDDPEVQAIVIDTFRQIPLTLDDKLSKRAFFTEGAFVDWTSVELQQMRDTKMIHENGIVNAYVASTVSAAEKNIISVPILTGATSEANKEAENRLNGLNIGKQLANLKVELADFLTEFNDYGFVRSYNWSDFILIWNKEYINAYRYVDFPTIFHKEDLPVDHILNTRWFTTPLATVTQSDTTTAVALIELDYTVADEAKHALPGDKLAQGTYTAGELLALANKVGTPRTDVIAKIVHKNAIKFMGALDVATAFYNPQTLRTNHYLTFGYSSPKYLKNYPFLTLVKEDESDEE